MVESFADVEGFVKALNEVNNGLCRMYAINWYDFNRMNSAIKKWIESVEYLYPLGQKIKVKEMNVSLIMRSIADE